MFNRRQMTSADYKIIGHEYSHLRRPDYRIQKLIDEQLTEQNSILNIGAGTGSYEPQNKSIVAVEPSITMIKQRNYHPNTKVYCAFAENLPFQDNSFDAAMAILTLHHWENWRLGLSEAKRIARNKMVWLTWIGMPTGFWLYEYFPDLIEQDKGLFPSILEMEKVVGPIKEIVVPIPKDCTDGFLCAYWARPEYYLQEPVRRAISTFSRIKCLEYGIKKLETDLSNGKWTKKFRHILGNDEMDYGYRLLVANC